MLHSETPDLSLDYPLAPGEAGAKLYLACTAFPTEQLHSAQRRRESKEPNLYLSVGYAPVQGETQPC